MKSIYVLFLAQSLILLLSSNVSLASSRGRSAASATEISAICSKNQVYSSCGSACPMICDDISNDSHSDRACTAACVEGCFCKEGYVLEEEKGKCIRVQECPRVKH